MIEFSDLPYERNELEPHLSQETLHYHHDKHHSKYVENTRKLIVGSSYENLSLREIIILSSLKTDDRSREICFNASQSWNHAFLWNCMTPKMVQPSEYFAQMIQKSFGSFETFIAEFKKSALGLQGSGWVWLTMSESCALSIIVTHGGDNPAIFGLTPLFCCDMWEHAYYLDYKNEKAEYLENYFKISNWNFVESNYRQKIRSNIRDAKQSGQSSWSM